MKHLIVIDLDDTLLTTDKKITDLNKTVIDKLKELGHIIVLATGRAFHGTIPYYEELDLNTIVITDNGAFISNPSDENFKDLRTTIPSETFTKMFDTLKHTIATGVINQNSISYGYNYNAGFDNSFNGIPPQKAIEADFYNLGFEPMNLDVAVYRDHQEKFESYFKNHPTLDARFWSADEDYGYYDIHLKSVNKAEAVKTAMKFYNLNKDQVITFGDGVNDTELLALTPNGTAMKNASSITKKYANNITEFDNNDSGVGRHLIKFFNL